MMRYEPVRPETMTEAQKAVHDSIASGPRGSVFGPFPVLLHSPGLADNVQNLGAFLRFGSSLPGNLREIAVLVTARFWAAEFEWYAHAPIARDEGVADGIVEAIRTGAEPSFADEAEEAVYRFSVALHETRDVDDALYGRVRALLGQEALTDLIAVCGYYTLLAMTLNLYRVPTPDGSTAFGG